MMKSLIVPLLLALATPAPASNASATGECVVFLHGLLRTSGSMEKIAGAFSAQGYAVANIDYPSNKLPIEELAPLATEAGVAQCVGYGKVHFVTHSMGGILVRYYLQEHQIANLGRVVMIAPPNGGSEVVDAMIGTPGYELLHGPAGLQLGTDAESIPAQLDPIDFEVGIIAGTRTVNFMLSQYLPNPDDGKVTLESTKVEGMQDFIALPHSHSFIMKKPATIDQAIAFIATGSFVHEVE
jgi:pimeloyl-ACP methyl ester carboxylesterase